MSEDALFFLKVIFWETIVPFLPKQETPAGNTDIDNYIRSNIISLPYITGYVKQEVRNVGRKADGYPCYPWNG